MKSAVAISFEWKASRLLQGAAAIVCALACLAVGLSDLPLPALAIFVPVAGLQLHRYGHPRCVRISGSEQGWQLSDRGHAAIPAMLKSHRSLGPFIQMHFLARGRHRYFLVAPDNLDADMRRRLRLLLARLPSA